jgi:hypothetical protein
VNLSDNYIGGCGLPPEFLGETTVHKATNKLLTRWIVRKKDAATEITVESGGNIVVEGNKIFITWEKL